MTIANSKSRELPLAVVGSQTSQDEIIFGRAFDKWVITRFLRHLYPYKLRIFLGISAVLIYTLTQLSIPLIVRETIDDALVENISNREVFHLLIGLFFCVVTINYAANHFMESIIGRTAQDLLFGLRRSMYEHLQRVSLSFMDKTEVGRLMSRLQGDVYALQEFLESSIFAVGDTVLLLGIVVVLLYLDPVLGALTLSIVPILFLVRIVWLPLARKAFLTAREENSATNGALAENVHGIRAIQELVREDLNFTLFEEKARSNLSAHLRASKFSNVIVPVVDTLTGGAMAIVIVVGGSMVLEKSLDIGVMVAFLFYVQRFFDPIRSLTLQYTTMQRAMASGQRIFEVTDVHIDVKDKLKAEDPSEIDGTIEFRNVTFGYEPETPILNNISFRVEPGEIVALVGPTGSGKTSTASLVKRFYDVWEGEIQIGGYDVRDIKQDTLARHIAMVLQEPFLFSATIAENISYAKSNATHEDIVSAAKTVGAHEFIMKLKDGYNTVLDQRGTNLSFGQRQLISFARALVIDAKILILDEATANVDSYTELKIQKALAQLLKGRTALVIAHRLGTIREANRIIVIRDGRICEQGNHKQLIASDGLYANLCQMNYASFDDMQFEETNNLTPTA